jgi:hypothetical protein
VSYRVVWDNGAGACGTFPYVFDTEDGANTFGRGWADESNVRDFGTGDPVDGYSFDVVEVPDNDGDEEPADEMGELRKAALSRGQP